MLLKNNSYLRKCKEVLQSRSTKTTFRCSRAIGKMGKYMSWFVKRRLLIRRTELILQHS